MKFFKFNNSKSDLSQSDAFCILPWIHLEVLPEGSCKICCVAKEAVNRDLVPLNLSESPLEEIRASRYMRGVRKALAGGKRIPVCSYCWGQEKRGETSLRQLWNSRFPESVKRLNQRTRQGVGLTDPMPLEYLQVSLGNKCNLACRMCNSSYSSRIAEDPVHSRWAPGMDRRGTAGSESDPPGSSRPHPIPASARPHWLPDVPWFEQQEFVEKDMIESGASLKLLYVTGGEPLLSESFERILEEYVGKGYARNIGLSINSNLFHNETQIRKAMQSFSQFKSCQMAASIDGYGEAYEYIRYPAKWRIVERNMRVLKSMADESRATVFLMTTVAQAYNCFNLVDLFRFSDELMIECNPHVLEGPAYLKPFVLPKDLRLDAAEQLRAYAASTADEGVRASNRGHAGRIVRYLEGIEDTEESEQARRTFADFTRALDESRGQSLARSVPQLASLL